MKQMHIFLLTLLAFFSSVSSCWKIEDLTKKKNIYSFNSDQTAASFLIAYLNPVGDCVDQFRVMSFSSCENAQEINTGSCSKEALPKGTYRYYKYSAGSDQNIFPILNKIKRDYSYVKPCVFSGKDNQIIDSNTPVSNLETSGNVQCSSKTALSVKAGSFKCIAVYSACNADYELKVFSSGASSTVTASGTPNSTMPVWSYASVPYSAAANGNTVPVFGTNSYAGIPLGFNFSYFGQTYSSIYITNNGTASFYTGKIDSTNPNNLFGYGYYNASGADTLLSAIAPWWGKLYADCSSSVTYETSGTAPDRVFTAEWKNIKYAQEKLTPTESPLRLSFQLKLYETSNKIEFHYGQSSGKITSSSSGSTFDLTGVIGISSGTAGIFMNGKSGSTKDDNTYDYTGFPVSGTVYRFSP